MKTLLALTLTLGAALYIHRRRYRRLARGVGAHYAEAILA